MALTGSTIASTYLKLLRANSDTMGADATASYIQDSADTDSVLSISTTRVGIGNSAPTALLTAGAITTLLTDGTTAVTPEGVNVHITEASKYAMGIKNADASGDGLIIQAGDASDDFALRVEDYDSANDLLVVQGGGLVGIGTAAPGQNLAGSTGDRTDASLLHIKNGSGHARFILEGNTGASMELVDVTGGSDLKIMQIAVSGDVTSFHSVDDDLGAYKTQNILILNHSSGNVGIGTTAPGAPLDIQRTVVGGCGTVPMLEITQLESGNMVPGDGASILFNTAKSSGSTEAGASIAALRTSGTDSNSSTLLEFRISQADASLDLAMQINEDGVVTKPLQPAFHYRPSADSKNENMAEDEYLVIVFDNELFDNGGDVAQVNGDIGTGTTIFTAPVAGEYLFSYNVKVTNVDLDTTYHTIALWTSNKIWYTYSYQNNTNYTADALYDMNHTVFTHMDAGDTAKVRFYQTSTGDVQADIQHSETWFAGYLAC